MIKAAIQSGLPPTAVILDDPTREWSFMDTRLIKAFWIEDQYGSFPPWIDQSDRVQFEVKSYTSRSAAAYERVEERESKSNKKKVYGRKYYAVPTVPDGGAMPTIEEWMEERARKQNGSG
jgi:hypothetical protein